MLQKQRICNNFSSTVLPLHKTQNVVVHMNYGLPLIWRKATQMDERQLYFKSQN